MMIGLLVLIYDMVMLMDSAGAKLTSKEIPHCAQQYHDKLFCLNELMHNPAQQRIRSQLFRKMSGCFQDPKVKAHCRRVIITQDRCHRLASERLPSLLSYQGLLGKVQVRIRRCYRTSGASGQSGGQDTTSAEQIRQSKRGSSSSDFDRCNGINADEKQCRARVAESWGKIMQNRDDLHRETLRWKDCMQIVSRECRYDFPSYIVRRCVLDAMESYFASERGKTFSKLMDYCQNNNGTLKGFVDEKLIGSKSSEHQNTDGSSNGEEKSGGSNGGEKSGGSNGGEKSGGSNGGEKSGGSNGGEKSGGSNGGEKSGGSNGGNKSGESNGGKKSSGSTKRRPINSRVDSSELGSDKSDEGSETDLATTEDKSKPSKKWVKNRKTTTKSPPWDPETTENFDFVTEKEFGLDKIHELTTTDSLWDIEQTTENSLFLTDVELGTTYETTISSHLESAETEEFNFKTDSPWDFGLGLITEATKEAPIDWRFGLEAAELAAIDDFDDDDDELLIDDFDFGGLDDWGDDFRN